MTAVRTLADRVFARNLANDWFTRARLGLPIESIRVEGAEAWRADAKFARAVLAGLETLTAEPEPRPKTTS